MNRSPFLLVAFLASAATTFEAAGPVPASRYLPAGQLSGPEWKVEPEAQNDGYTNTYTLTSRFGSWEARGRTQVAVRGREIQALAKLEEVSKSEVFMDAVKKSATAPLQLVASVTTKPVETIKGVPAGVNRWFKKTSYQVKETYHDTKETVTNRDEEEKGKGGEDDPGTTETMKQQASKYALDQLKISSAERRWYADLGVDPYTDNEVVRKAVQSVARVEGLTSFGMRYSGLPSIPGAGEIRKTMDLVWKTDPWELRLRNRKILLAAGVSEETARAFEDNPALSLTLQTEFINALSSFEGVAGRQHLLARALEVDSLDEARALVSSTSLLLQLHRGGTPLKEFLAGTRLPVARTAKNGLVAVSLADAVFWTEGVAEAAKSLAGIYAGDPATSRRLFVVGEVSGHAKSEVRKLGWEIADRWQAPASKG